MPKEKTKTKDLNFFLSVRSLTKSSFRLNKNILTKILTVRNFFLINSEAESNGYYNATQNSSN